VGDICDPLHTEETLNVWYSLPDEAKAYTSRENVREVLKVLNGGSMEQTQGKKREMQFGVACRDFFGMLDRQGLKEFMARDLRSLTDQDRKEIAVGLEQNGYHIIP
jgi:hypothetical protein